MNMKKMIVVLSLILIMSLCFEVISIGYALNPIDAMKPMEDNNSTAEGAGSIGPVINAVIGTIQVAGTGIALIMISILGIKYMMSAPNEKADVKKQITPMAIGAIILFGSVNIIQIIASFTETIFN